MKRTLVTLLGRARKSAGGKGYEKVDYRFPGDGVVGSTFFGLALARHLKPDEIVILGTTGSLWSVLVEDLVVEDDKGADLREKLACAEDESTDVTVDQQLLNELAPLLTERIIADVKVEVRLVLISGATDESEQYAILEAIDKAVEYNGELHFDLTHGFRHLGMVGFLSSFMLERLRPNLGVHGLWYGAFDMMERASRVVPVLRLDGLTRVRLWLDALNHFDASGNYGVFEQLLIKDGLPKHDARYLKDAAFYERTLNVHDAAAEISKFLAALERCTLDGASGLFLRRLKVRLAWAKKKELSEQQRSLALVYLGRGDFVRAAMFGWEACVSRLCEGGGYSTVDFAQRKDAQEEYLIHGRKNKKKTAFNSLRILRNAVTHGYPASKRTRSTLKDPGKLSDEIREAMRIFF